MSKPTISLLGATYSDVSGVELPVSGGGVAEFPFVEGSQTITKNGTYNVRSLASVTVDIGWEKLWTNSSPSDNFNAQTIPVDLSAYSIIAIECIFNTTSANHALCFGIVGKGTLLNVPNLGSTQYYAKREASVASTGVTFGTGYRNTTSTTGASYCIPVSIYGVA